MPYTKEQLRLYRQARYKRLKESGTCTDCAKRPITTGVLCDICRGASRARDAKRSKAQSRSQFGLRADRINRMMVLAERLEQKRHTVSYADCFGRRDGYTFEL